MPEEMKLKSCPFCGGKTVVSLNRFNIDSIPMFFGKCTSCGAEGRREFSEKEAIADWNRRTPEPGTSVIRWQKYDGTPETAAESHRTVLFIDDDEVRCGRVMDDDRGMRLQVGKLLWLVFECGDLWAYLPEPPEGME